VKDEWSALLMNVFDRLPNPKDWTHISENSVRFQSIYKNIEEYSEQLVNLLNGLANHGLRATAGSAAPSPAAAVLRATVGSAAPSPAAAGRRATAGLRATAGSDEDIPLLLRPCDARAGHYVEIFWATPGYIGWWKGTVQEITSKGKAIVIYEATPENNGWDPKKKYTHNLAASRHFTNVGETHLAWKLVASRIDAGRTAASTRSLEVSCPHSWYMRYQLIVMPSVL
jgi:hypothetical protein